MRAIRIPYPPPTTLPNYAQLENLSRREELLIFPIATSLTSFMNAAINRRWRSTALAVLKAIDSHPRGGEPERLELRLPALQ